MKITIKRTSDIELTAGRNWGWNAECKVRIGTEDTTEATLKVDCNGNYTLKVDSNDNYTVFTDETCKFTAKDYASMKIELSGIEAILEEITTMIQLKENEKKAAEEKARKDAAGKAYDQSVLINDLKPEIEKLGYKVKISITKEEYLRHTSNRIRLIINDGQYEAGFSPYNGNFEAIKTGTYRERIEKTTKSMKVAKMLDAFSKLVIIDKHQQENKKKDKQRAASDQEKLQKALGIEITQESTEHYPRDYKGRATGGSYMVHTYHPKENTKITVGVREKFNYETKENHDEEYTINIPQIISRDPEVIKEIYNLIAKYAK